jgi:hypothetical protein
MYLDKFVHSNTGKILMSIILGIGLATFFRSVCIGRNCRVFSSPPIEEIDEQTYKFNDKCYKYTAKTTSCKAPPNADNIQTIDSRT